MVDAAAARDRWGKRGVVVDDVGLLTCVHTSFARFSPILSSTIGGRG